MADVNRNLSSDVVTESRRRRSHSKSPLRRLFRWLKKAALAPTLIILTLAIVIVGIVLFAALTTDATVRVREALASTQRTVNSLTGQAVTELTANDIDRLQASLTELQKAMQNAEQQTRLLQPLAGLNADLGVTYQVLAAAQDTVASGIDMLDGFKPTAFYLTGGDQRSGATVSPQLSEGERIVELLRMGQTRFNSARTRLDRAAQVLKGLDAGQVSPDTFMLISSVRQYQQQLTEINTVLIQAPDFLSHLFGIDGTRAYLVLAANSDELRPSGGYLSTYGWLTVRRLRIGEYGYSATTDKSPNPPPAAMVSELNIPSWWIQFSRPIYTAWDGSWYADFPGTARMAAWYYDHGDNPLAPVDGVIGIDLFAFQRILDALGPVTVPDYNETLSADNYRDVIYRVRAERTTPLEHKQFVASAYRQVVKELQQLDETRTRKVLLAVLQALQEKHIVIYLVDNRFNATLNTIGWSGAQHAGGSDYLMAVDANLTNKSNRSIVRQITLDVAIQEDGTAINRASLTYDYASEVADKDPAVRPEHYNVIDYRNLLQVFVAGGSKLLSSDNIETEPVVLSAGKFTQFISTVNVSFDTTERFQYRYQTPVVVQSSGSFRRYTLTLQKQLGTQADEVEVQIVMPPNVTVISTTPQPLTSYTLETLNLTFKVKLTTDQTIDIVWKPAKS